MGNAQSEAPPSADAKPSPPPGHHVWAGVEGATCPVKHETPVHKALLSGNIKPIDTDAKAEKKDSPRYKGTVYNVYSQPIDPTNMMPAANQAPSPGQKAPLSTERVKSTIPKGGTEGTWLYPSPQMFWNSLVRKGKNDGVNETDVDMVVAIHNEMNERTWKQLVRWEEEHKAEQFEGEPALRRFQGNPWSPSPKAKLKSALGFGWPFDRHDWYVDRGGKQVHYVIDYYFNPAGSAVSQKEVAENGLKYTHMIHVDVRPAVDDVTSVIDRLKGFPRRAVEALGRPRYVAEGLDPKDAPKDEVVQAQKHTSESYSAPGAAAPAPVAQAGAQGGTKWDEVDIKCGPLLGKLAGAGDEDSRRSASVALNYCMARILCPSQANTFMSILERNEAAGTGAGQAGGEEEQAFHAMTQCVLQEMKAKPRPLTGASATSPKLQ